MELSSFDGFVETSVVARAQRSRCSENSLDKSDERRAPPAHTMASHRFPSTTFVANIETRYKKMFETPFEKRRFKSFGDGFADFPMNINFSYGTG
jgi:hypothetical protein